MDRAKAEKELLRLLEEEAREKEAGRKLIEQTNDKFYPLYTDRNRYLVLVGGGGSGKSIFAGRKILERLTKEKGHRFLVVRKVARTLRESCFQQLQGQISEHYNYADFTINKTDMKIMHKPTGNEIIFSGLDDVEKMKSIYNISGIWIEEASELEETDLNQLNIRLRGETKHYKQIILTFNPIDINHWLKKRFFDVAINDALTVHSTYKDNKFLDDEAIKVLESFKDTDPYYYSVYCLGEWGVLGNSIFDKNKVSARLAEIRNRKYKIGYFEYDYDGLKLTNIKWVDDPQGYIKLYKDKKDMYPYVIGADTAGGEGTEHSDFFVCQVIDNATGEQVAMLRDKFDEDIFTRQMYCLGWYYNQALVGAETNFSTYPTKELARLEYPNMYTRQQEDSIVNGYEGRYGFRTDSKTRPIIIAILVALVREHPELFNDIVTLEEMLTFARNEKGKPCAVNGAHDDTVMAMAITYYIREQQDMIVKVKEYEIDWSALPIDLLEDYERADEKWKAIILESWRKQGLFKVK